MEGFIFYSSFLEATKDLDNEQFGIVMRAITEYGINGIVPENMDPITKIVFTLVRPQIDANAKRREDGARGGRPSKQVSDTENHGFQNKKPVVSDTENHGSTDEEPKEKEKEKVKVKDKEKDKTLSPSKEGEGCVTPAREDRNLSDVLEERFERFWSVYPKKVGKGDARKSFMKIKPSDALLGKMVTAVIAASASFQWKKDNGQFIPNPATWLNQQRWEDDVPPDMGMPDQKQAPPGKNRFANFEQRPYTDEDEAIGTAWLQKAR